MFEEEERPAHGPWLFAKVTDQGRDLCRRNLKKWWDEILFHHGTILLAQLEESKLQRGELDFGVTVNLRTKIPQFEFLMKSPGVRRLSESGQWLPGPAGIRAWRT